MAFFRTKQGRIFAVLAVCFIISLFFNITYIQKDKKYEKYLSEQIGNTLRPMGADINQAEILLEKANNSGYISRDDLNSLYYIHQAFVFGLQDAFHLYEMTGKKHYIPAYSTSYYLTLYNELSSLNKEVQRKNQSIYKITDANKYFFSQMQKMTGQFADIFGTSFYNWDFSISKGKWIDIIKQIDSVTNKTFN